HAHVGEDHVGAVLAGGGQGRLAVAGLGDDGEVRGGVQQRHQPGEHGGVVVGDEHADRRTRRGLGPGTIGPGLLGAGGVGHEGISSSSSSWRARAGSRAWTCHSWGSSRAGAEPALPPTASARCAIVPRPTPVPGAAVVARRVVRVNVTAPGPSSSATVIVSGASPWRTALVTASAAMRSSAACTEGSMRAGSVTAGA